MRIVIDLQGAQTESRFRGIGYYSLAFAKAIVRNRAGHNVFIVLSGLFPHTIEKIRAEFDDILPQENIRVWYAPGPVKEENPDNACRREVAELIREAFIASLLPDIVHISSLFEGYVDDAVTSIGKFDNKTPVSVSLYDLIPLLNPDHYLKPNQSYETYYVRKINYLNHTSLLLAISEFTKQEGIENLSEYRAKDIINVSTAVDEKFHPMVISKEKIQILQDKFKFTRALVLYTGGVDERKNLSRLLRAYAQLSTKIRRTHQLVFVGKIPQGNIKQLHQEATQAGLGSDELILTGYVTDEELVELYNICKLYVFPSWHEGFGLPALEAMECGAAVIGANTTSLPEVINNPKAMFDPFSEDDIAKEITEALTNENFRQSIIKSGLKQAKQFDWDKSAKIAISGFENIVKEKNNASRRTPATHILSNQISKVISKPISEQNIIDIALAIGKNHPQTGLKQLFVDVSELSQRDSATGVQRVTRSILIELLNTPPVGYRVEPVYAIPQVEGYFYAKKYTAKLLGLSDDNLLDELLIPMAGDIFLGLDLQHHVVTNQNTYYEQLKNKDVALYFVVYDLLPITFSQYFAQNHSELHAQWLTVISQFNGLVCISETVAKEAEEWLSQYVSIKNKSLKITYFHMGADIENSIPSKGLLKNSDNLLRQLQVNNSFLMVGTIEPRKRQNQVLSAFEVLWAKGENSILVIVGQQGWMTEELIEKIQMHPELNKRLFWLNGISDEYLEKIYKVSTCLIAASEGEGFGLPLIEAAQHKLPMIIRDIPVFKEVAGEYAYYFQSETAQGLAEVVETWLELYIKNNHLLSDKMPWLTWKQSTDSLLEKILPLEVYKPIKQLFVDISELVQRDAKTGIQRVVRSLLKELLSCSNKTFRVEPVYATICDGYRYARHFTSGFIDGYDSVLADELIEYRVGDVFLGLDLQPQVILAQQNFYQQLRRHGIQVHFVVYDLLCILMPQYFVKGAAEGHDRWLEVISESDGAICISSSVADELGNWINEHVQQRIRPFNISWFHLGADVGSSVPSLGMPDNAATLLQMLAKRRSFLVVGTIEPRKAHAQILAGFEQLWVEQEDINLVIVGKQGWMVESLVTKLRGHPEKNKRLFWLEGISDEYLEKVYAASVCLIAASEGEGFGLPLIEAAQHKLSIIARDIPVFKEVAGENAFYFEGNKPEDLANAVKKWLDLYTKQVHPKSDSMPYLTWKESAGQLLNILTV